MMAIDPKKLVLTAQQAVSQAAAHANANLHRREESLSIDAHDIKLALDVECQALIESCIHESFPEHAILGEEGATPKLDMPYEWIIDPIDGTVNFFMDFPIGVVPLPFNIMEKRSQAPSMLLKPMNFFPPLWESLPAATEL